MEPVKKKYKIVGVAANLIYRKGIDQLVNAMVELEDVFLLIIGEGKLKKSLIKMAKKKMFMKGAFF